MINLNDYIPLMQTINYLGLTGASAIAGGLCVLYYIHYRKEPAAVVAAVYFAISVGVYFLLSLATGLHPLTNLDNIRPLVHVFRSGQLIAQLWLIATLSRTVRKGI